MSLRETKRERERERERSTVLCATWCQKQLQGIENVEDVNDDNHGQSLNLPYGTEDMLGNSLSDISTPTFEGGFGTYRQYLADADYISTPL